MSRLFDKAADIALLRTLMQDREVWLDGPALVQDTIHWMGWHWLPASSQAAIASGMHGVLRGWGLAGILDKQTPPRGGLLWRMAPSLTSGDIKRLTGGIDPLRASPEECDELDLPSVKDMRRVEFRPDAYLKGSTEASCLQRVLWQCPSPFEMAHRIQTLDNRKHTSKRKDNHGQATAG